MTYEESAKEEIFEDQVLQILKYKLFYYKGIWKIKLPEFPSVIEKLKKIPEFP